MSNRFILFGFEHFLAIGTGIGIGIFILLLAFFMDRRGRIIFLRFLSLLVFGIKVGEILYKYYYNGETYIQLLPLHLCSLALILAIITSFVGSSFTFQPLYFWGIGAVFAIATPELNYGLKDPVSLSFFITHFFIILSIIYSMIYLRLRPSKAGVISSFFVINLAALGIFFINKELGTNYLYINRLPNTSTLLDVLGIWPYYIISVELVYLVLSFILYYPFRKRSFKYNSFS